MVDMIMVRIISVQSDGEDVNMKILVKDQIDPMMQAVKEHNGIIN